MDCLLGVVKGPGLARIVKWNCKVAVCTVGNDTPRSFFFLMTSASSLSYERVKKDVSIVR